MADVTHKREEISRAAVDESAPAGRYRARVRGGGYRRTTVSLPVALSTKLGEYLKAHPSRTASAFMSDALEVALASAASKEQ